MCWISGTRHYIPGDLGRPHTQNRNVCNRSELGVWSSSDPGKIAFNPGMKNYLEELRTRRVLRVVTVIQPPFMIVSNNTTSKEVNKQ